MPSGSPEGFDAEIRSIVSGLEKGIDGLDARRERGLEASRAVVRCAREAIRALHRGEDAAPGLKELKRLLRSVPRDIDRTSPPGYLLDAMQEASEAFLLAAYIGSRPPPAPEAVGAGAPAYLLGLADFIGELRRLATMHIHNGRFAAAGRCLVTMEELHAILMRFDHPDAVLPIRRKLDVAASLIEKTREELAHAARSRRLERRLRRVERRLRG